MRHFFIPIVLLFGVCTADAQPIINKCIVNDKTIYSDEKCPKNATRQQVEINHAAGIVSPDRDTVTETIDRMHDERWANAVPGRSITRTTTRGGKTVKHTTENPRPKQVRTRAVNKKATCESIATRIAHLDALARRPQSARTQEQIKREKAKKRSEEFEAGC